nr:MAG TPA: hypothetical protein [Caudoviricetes sp.]
MKVCSRLLLFTDMLPNTTTPVYQLKKHCFFS